MEARKLTPEEIVPASRKLGRDDASALARAASMVAAAEARTQAAEAQRDEVVALLRRARPRVDKLVRSFWGGLR